MRSGFEVLFSTPGRLEGHTTADERGEIWWVGYRIEVDALWRTPGEAVSCPAVYVRADLTVERLEQGYTARSGRCFGYTAPAFGFTAELCYDESGLVVDYPGIARRVG
jgi:hypothetical protein